MSGHSKWKQIKHKKASTDAKRGQLFSKLVREIMVASKTGGSDPETNLNLRSTIERARSQGLPKGNIERAIEKTKSLGEANSLQEFLLEAMAPERALILIKGITDNKNRSLAELKHLLANYGARPADPGSLLWNFEKVGTLTIPESTKTTGEYELSIIEAGAKDIFFADSLWIVETLFEDRDRVRKNLEKQGISIREAGMDYKPKNPLWISEEKTTALEPLLEALSDHDDVQDVYTNVQ